MNNRNKGHNAEREFAKVFRKWFPFCKTSREASRLYDSCKVDLWGLPLLIQIKAGYPKGIPYSTILNEMNDKLIESFPKDSKEHTLPRLIIHKKDPSKRGRGAKRNINDTLVVMSFNDFIKIYKKTFHEHNKDTKNSC